MNLHDIAAAVIGAVNPPVTAFIRRSTGYTSDADGHRVPTYREAIPVQAQVQSLTYNDLMQVSGLDVEGERRALYLNGNWEGVIRADQTGGDLIELPDGTHWLVVQVLENWASEDGWVKVAVTRQARADIPAP